MNRYRFYEIIQAHKNGEDLSKFTPKNKPEADLINALQGGGGDSAGSVKNLIKERNYDATSLFNGFCGESVDKYISYDETGHLYWMTNMFANCNSLKSIRVDASMASSISGICEGCQFALETVEINNTGACYSMDNAFKGCCSLVNLSPLNTDMVSEMNYTFYACESLETIDITALPRFTGKEKTFGKCHSLKKLIIRDMYFIPENIEGMFENCCRLLGTSYTSDYTYKTYNPDCLKDGRIYVPDDKVEELKAAQGWSDFADVIVPLSTLEE